MKPRTSSRVREDDVTPVCVFEDDVTPVHLHMDDLNPVHVHVDEATPVHVYVDDDTTMHLVRSRDESLHRAPEVSCPSATDSGRVSCRRKAADKKRKQKAVRNTKTLPADADQFLQSRDPSPRYNSHTTAITDDEPQEFEFDFGTPGEGSEHFSVDQDSLEGTSRQHTYITRSDSGKNRWSGEDLSPTDRQLLLKTLTEAQEAAHSVATQLVEFKGALGNNSAEPRLHDSHDGRVPKQKNILLEKLEEFKSKNHSVRQHLQDFQTKEADRLQAERLVDDLMKKLTQAETDNLQLKKNLEEKESQIRELNNLRKTEVENTESVAQLTRAVNGTQAHLQGQLRSKEAENNRLSTQLRSLEQTLAQHRQEMERLREEHEAVLKKANQEKEGLKKAVRAHKLRAKRFEAKIETCFKEINEKKSRLEELTSSTNTWKVRHDEAVEEKLQLESQLSSLKTQIADMSAQLEKEKASVKNSNSDVRGRVEKLNTERAEINLENTALKATIADLEEKLSRSKADLAELSSCCQKQSEQSELFQQQMICLKGELEDLKAKCENQRKGNERSRDQKEAKIEKMKDEMETRVKELEPYRALVVETEQTLREAQENLQRSEKQNKEKTDSLRELQEKVFKSTAEYTSSLCAKSSMEEANTQLILQLQSLQRKVEEVQQENLELVERLASQEEALRFSGAQLEQRSSMCLSLVQQLEITLADVKQQISTVKEKANLRERVLQAKILELEGEKSRQEAELKRLRQSKQAAEKQYEVRLKDLQLSLEQSESHKQSIQNYVDFLKSSYTTMFEDGFPSAPETTSFFKY